MPQDPWRGKRLTRTDDRNMGTSLLRGVNHIFSMDGAPIGQPLSRK